MQWPPKIGSIVETITGDQLIVRVVTNNAIRVAPSWSGSTFALPKKNVRGVYVNFGDVARGQLGQQCQYACRYTGIDNHGDYNPDYWKELNYPSLGEGLRFLGNTNDYHSLMIHEDDIEEFVRRYKERTVLKGEWEERPPIDSEDV